MASERKLFKQNVIGMQQLYDKLSKQTISKYTTKLWVNYNDNLAKLLLPEPPFNFLHDPEIAGSMFVNAGGSWMDQQISLLESTVKPETLKVVLRENKIGKPDLISKEYNTSHNSIHHLYHLARYEKETRTSTLGYKTVVEWGGGYGNFAKLYLRLNSFRSTYIIIDTPLFIVLQKAYLESILGESSVNVITKPNQKIVKGKVNLLPVGLLDKNKLECDVFVSTWALSESSKYAQDYVAKRNFFGAKQILLAYQNSYSDLPDASRIEELIRSANGKVYGIPFIKTSHYGFL